MFTIKREDESEGKIFCFHFFEMFKKIFDFIFRCCVEIIIKEYHFESDK